MLKKKKYEKCKKNSYTCFRYDTRFICLEISHFKNILKLRLEVGNGG